MRLTFRPWIQGPLCDTADMGGGGGTTEREPAQDAMTRPHAEAGAAGDEGDDDGDEADGDGDDAGGDETDGSDDRPDFRESFRRALTQHSKPGRRQAAAGAEDAGRDENAGDAETQKDEQPKPGKTARTATTEDEHEGLLTDAEYEALESQYEGKPKELRKALEAAYTKKTQQLSVRRASLERLQPYAELVDALESDNPKDVEDALRVLAEDHGIDLTVKPAATAAKTDDAVEVKAEALLEEFKAALGPELDYLADGLMPAVRTLIERLVPATVEKRVKPLEARAQVDDEKAAIAENNRLFEEFSKAVPEWKTQEDAMFELSKTILPAKGAAPIEYLRTLYTLATAKASATTNEAQIEAEVAKRLEKRLTKTRRSAEAVAERVDDVGDRQVQRKGPKTPTFQESYEAAKRGEVFAD